MTERILRIGRRHLAEHGAAALSLRAVTRDLGMVSSAVYRYVANRDDLLTMLVVDAYTELGDAVDAALDAPGVDGSRWESQVLTVCRAFRTWAVAEPARYALLYGSPVPGYEAPGEVTIEPGIRVVLRLVHLLDEAAARGQIALGDDDPGPYGVPLPSALAADFAAVGAEIGSTALDAPALGRAVFFWTMLVGAVSAEIFGQLGAQTIALPELHLEHQMRLALAVVRGGSTPPGS